LRRPDDTSPLLGRQRRGRVVGGDAPLHLDEGEPLALERHQIDLAHGHLATPGDDCVASEPEHERGDGLGE